MCLISFTSNAVYLTSRLELRLDVPRKTEETAHKEETAVSQEMPDTQEAAVTQETPGNGATQPAQGDSDKRVLLIRRKTLRIRRADSLATPNLPFEL